MAFCDFVVGLHAPHGNGESHVKVGGVTIGHTRCDASVDDGFCADGFIVYFDDFDVRVGGRRNHDCKIILLLR